jgi:hypothetical protein
MGYDACIPEFLIGFLNFEMGLLEKILIYTSQPWIGALRCTLRNRWDCGYRWGCGWGKY